MMLTDAHAHFFSSGFFGGLARELSEVADPAVDLPARLGWTAPGTDASLADRWVAELDRYGVSRAMLMASMPGDEAAVAAAVRRHPSRIVGGFMLNPAMPDAEARVDRALGEQGLSTVCLFPAMHHVPVDDPRSEAVFAAAARRRGVVFVHCGVLSIGVRTRLGLPSPFDLRLGDPLAVAAVAVRYPSVPVVIPHFGAGLFREALMAAASAPNIVFDTSSSNGWIRFHPGFTLRTVFEQALHVLGPARLLFGSDSSFFPRGWQQAVCEQQRATLTDLGVTAADQTQIFSGNFARLYGGST